MWPSGMSATALPNQKYTRLLDLDARIKSTVQMSGMWWTDVLDVHVFEKVSCVTYTPYTSNDALSLISTDQQVKMIFVLCVWRNSKTLTALTVHALVL